MKTSLKELANLANEGRSDLELLSNEESEELEGGSGVNFGCTKNESCGANESCGKPKTT